MNTDTNKSVGEAYIKMNESTSSTFGKRASEASKAANTANTVQAHLRASKLHHRASVHHDNMAANSDDMDDANAHYTKSLDHLERSDDHSIKAEKIHRANPTPEATRALKHHDRVGIHPFAPGRDRVDKPTDHSHFKQQAAAK